MASPCRRIHKTKKLSLEDKYGIIHDVLIKHEFQADVAKRYRVRLPTVCRLVNKAKKRPEFLREICSKEEERTQTRESVSQIVQELNDEDVFISSSA